MVVVMKLLKAKRKYSILIIPQNNKSVKSIDIKIPNNKILIALGLLVVLILSTALFSITQFISNKNNEYLSLVNDLEVMTKTIEQQSKLLQDSQQAIEAAKDSEHQTRQNFSNFVKSYSQITDKYASNISRGSSSNIQTTAASDIMKLNTLIEEINNSYTLDEEVAAKLDKSNTALEQYVDSLPTLLPTRGEISSNYGMRVHPTTKKYTKHYGVDIAADTGDPILAAASGIVTFSGSMSGYGYAIIIDHQNGFKTLYGHASKLLAEKGEKVKKGQVIAKVGSTGRSTGPHLHFELKVNNTAVDPTEYMDFSSLK